MIHQFYIYCSSISGGARAKPTVQKKSLTNETYSEFNFTSMSDHHSGVCAVSMVSPSVGCDDEHFEKSQDDITPPSVHSQFQLCQRSQLRRNTDFSQASQDLKKFLAEREAKRRDSDHDILPSPSYKYVYH